VCVYRLKPGTPARPWLGVPGRPKRVDSGCTFCRLGRASRSGDADATAACYVGDLDKTPDAALDAKGRKKECPLSAGVFQPARGG